VHELAIADSIVKTVLGEMTRRRLSRIEAVGLRIGALSDIVPEALEFGFRALTADTILADTRLDIERIPVRGHCSKCHVDFEVEKFVFICPECGAVEVKVSQGTELDVAYLEIDEPQELGELP